MYSDWNCLPRCIATCPGVNLPTFFAEPAAASYKVDLKMEAACVSETCVNLYHFTWHYVSEDSFFCNNIGLAVTASKFHNLSCKNMAPIDIILKSALMFNGIFQKSVSINSGGLMGNTLVMIHWVTALFRFIYLYWHMLILLHTWCWVGIKQQQVLKQIVYLAHHYSYLVWMSYTLIRDAMVHLVV